MLNTTHIIHTKQHTKKFYKMQALGNDFMISFDNFTVSEITSLAKRHTGIGFDQALLISTYNHPDSINTKPYGTDSQIKTQNQSSYHVKVYNADGSEAGFCGNGFRCVGALLSKLVYPFESDHSTSTKTTHFHTDAGLIEATVNFTNKQCTSSNTTINFPKAPQITKIDEHTYKVDIGNQHIISFNPDKLPFKELYTKHIAQFGDINVFWVQEYDINQAKVIGYERGTGLTQACGSGACAISCVMTQFFGCNPDFTVLMPGGNLQMKFVNQLDNANIILQTGPTQEVFIGEISI